MNTIKEWFPNKFLIINPEKKYIYEDLQSRWKDFVLILITG
jgi:hypothetical protein